MLVTSFTWHGDEYLHTRASCHEYAERGTTTGIPFLYPWANRLGGLEYDFNNNHVTLDTAVLPITVVSPGGAIHGLHHGSLPWKDDGSRHEAEAGRVSVRSHLTFTEECHAFAAFPFPHRIDLEYTLSPEGMQLQTTVQALSVAPVPMTFGYHPYFSLPGSPREEWELRVPVAKQYPLHDMIPSALPEKCLPLTGRLAERTFDSCFVMPSEPLALASPSSALHMTTDSTYRCLQVYAPDASPFICLEPMTAPPAPFKTFLGPPHAVSGDSPFTTSFRLFCSKD